MGDYNSISDNELAAAIKQSDAAAFEAFYFRYYRSLYGFVWRLSQSGETAKECVQEAFIRLWENRERLDCNLSIKSYLYRIAKNVFLSHVRREKIHRRYISKHEHQRPLSVDDNLDIQNRVQRTLQKLPDKVRMVFVLNRLEGFKYSEIAEMAGISIKTVESRMSKALRLINRG